MKGIVNSMATIPSLNDCKPGIKPSEYNVLIAPESAEEVTKGGIILTVDSREMLEASAMKGRLVAVSPHAFTYVDSWPEGTKPQVGDAVTFGKYAGVLFKGADGREYRLCKDKDVSGRLEEEEDGQDD